MTTYAISLETATFEAFCAIKEVDEKFIGTVNYLGVAFFWYPEFKHWLRDCTIAERKKVHQQWLVNNLSFEAGNDLSIDCTPHWQIIKKVCKTVATAA